MDPVLSFDQVSKSYGGAPAVRELSFSVAPGTVCGFLGPNGAGKSTSLRMIAGIHAPDAGTIRLLGAPPNHKTLKRIGFLPEERGLYKKMRADAAIAYFGALKGLSGADARKRARELLEAGGLGAHRRKLVKTLSKGMAQKVQILAAIAHDPEFVILDEPFSGLDPVNQKSFEEIVRDLRARGRTVLFSTHVMEHAERLCDSIVLIAKGRKVFEGGVEEALALAPRSALVETDAGFDLAGILTTRNFSLRGAILSVAEQNLQRAEIVLETDSDSRRLLAALVEAQAPLRLFEPRKPHLHDVFVRLVGENATPAG